MTRTLKSEERQRRARARREGALARSELRYPSSPREPAEGATSFPVKARDPDLQRMIDEAIAKRRT